MSKRKMDLWEKIYNELDSMSLIGHCEEFSNQFRCNFKEEIFVGKTKNTQKGQNGYYIGVKTSDIQKAAYAIYVASSYNVYSEAYLEEEKDIKYFVVRIFAPFEI